MFKRMFIGGRPATPSYSKTKLPGGLGVGSQVYFCGSTHEVDHETRVDYSRRGRVVGPSEVSSDRRVMVKFPGNRIAVACLLTELTREWPPPPLPDNLKAAHSQ